eukprot:CAMPEP_0197942198 /NCGR_PEP_ID=MMETSP1439-20131203/123983_1 /TAXON_ID=66791 /ORGANISM="Gonyaulax spinifera, Strain CCMP409" /LENGTH=90 /DNA_ID=CAMNT_0043565441 /DNA_START=65 /DNA_END=334 /DNA_ORIENTATION=-
MALALSALSMLVSRFLLVLCLSFLTLAEASPQLCAESAGYNECHIRKDASTLVSFVMGVAGSIVIAQLTGLQGDEAGQDAERMFSIHAIW